MPEKSRLQTRNATPKPAISLSQSGLLQRTCACGGVPGLTGECEGCASQRLSGQQGNPPALPNRPSEDRSTAPMQGATPGGYSFGNLAIEPQERLGIQAKLAIGQPGDRYEQEADRVADQVMRIPESRLAARRMSSIHSPSIQQNWFASQEKLQQQPIDVEEEQEKAIQPKAIATQTSPLIQGQTEKIPDINLFIQRQQPGSTATPPNQPTSSTAAFAITDIPRIQHALGWGPAAVLLDDWFSRSASTGFGSPNTTAVTMAYVLGFSRAKTVYDAMVSDRIWINSVAQTLVKNRALPLPGPGVTRAFGRVTGSPVTLDTNHVNHRIVSQGIFAPLDGLAGALANFGFYVLVQGRISDIGASPWYSPFTSRIYRINIDNVGIYIKDSFDFNGNQDLGCWDPVANTVSRTSIGNPNAHCVNNETFRNWRLANGRGGDFLVFSDIQTLSVSDSFEFNE